MGGLLSSARHVDPDACSAEQRQQRQELGATSATTSRSSAAISDWWSAPRPDRCPGARLEGLGMAIIFPPPTT